MRNYLTILFLLLIPAVYSQHLSWQSNISYGGTSNTAQQVVSDEDGFIYICGSFSTDLGSYYERGVFLEKYDPLGNLIWFDTTISTGVSGVSLELHNEHLYLTGQCSGGNDQLLFFGSSSLFKPSTAMVATFFAKYDLSGNVQTSQIILNVSAANTDFFNNRLYLLGGSTSCGGSVLKTFDTNLIEVSSICLGTIPYVFDVEVVDENNIYICKGGGSSSEHRLRKYDIAGNLVWNIPTATFSYDIDVDSIGNCYVAGYGGGSARIKEYDSAGSYLSDYAPPGAIAMKVHCSGSDMYVAGVNYTNQLSLLKYTNDTLIYSFLIGNYTPVDIARKGSNIYMTIKGNDAYSAAYIIKISEEGLATEVVELEGISSLSIYPNPSPSTFNISYNAVSKEDLQLNVINSKGQVIFTENKKKFQGEYRKEIDLSNYARGVYSIEIIQGKEKQVKRVVVN